MLTFFFLVAFLLVLMVLVGLCMSKYEQSKGDDNWLGLAVLLTIAAAVTAGAASAVALKANERRAHQAAK